MFGDHVDDMRVIELEGRQVDGDADMVWPVRRFFERGVEHPLADLADQPSLLREGHELGGRDGTTGGVLPPHQRFEA